MLISDITRDAEQGLHLTVEPDEQGEIEVLNDAFAHISAQARAAIAEDGYVDGVGVELAADLRYRGQSHELTVSLNAGHHAEAVREAFHRGPSGALRLRIPGGSRGGRYGASQGSACGAIEAVSGRRKRRGHPVR